MTAISAILCRLDAGRPLIFGGDPLASFAAREIALAGATPLGRLVREAPHLVAELYEQEIAAGVDVLCALTGETTTRALGRIGMGYRAAALTGAAVDLACEAADRAIRPIAVAGVLGARGMGPTPSERLTEEYSMHAARLAAAGCEILVARGLGEVGAPAPVARVARRGATVAASSTGLPMWAHLELGDGETTREGEPIEECIASVLEAGAQVVILEVERAEIARVIVERFSGALGEARFGTLVAVPPGTTRADTEALQRWAASVKGLVDVGARVVGGGAGATGVHTAALARTLGRTDPTSIWPRAV